MGSLPPPWVPWWASLVAPLAKNSCQLQQWTMEIDGKWWEMMGIWWIWEDHPLDQNMEKPENKMEKNLKWRHMDKVFLYLSAWRCGDAEPGLSMVIPKALAVSTRIITCWRPPPPKKTFTVHCENMWEELFQYISRYQPGIILQN